MFLPWVEHAGHSETETGYEVPFVVEFLYVAVYYVLVLDALVEQVGLHADRDEDLAVCEPHAHQLRIELPEATRK